MNKTIKQIADDIGVTPQAIYQRKKQEPLSTSLKEHAEKKGNTVYIDEIGQALITQAFHPETLKTFNQPVENQNSVVESLFKVLENELSTKNETIESQQNIILAQQETINELSTTLKQMTDSLNKSQALHAGTTKALLDSIEDTGETKVCNTPLKKENDTPDASPPVPQQRENPTKRTPPPPPRRQAAQSPKGFWAHFFKQ